jgi:hypothetical protein
MCHGLCPPRRAFGRVGRRRTLDPRVSRIAHPVYRPRMTDDAAQLNTADPRGTSARHLPCASTLQPTRQPRRVSTIPPRLIFRQRDKKRETRHRTSHPRHRRNYPGGRPAPIVASSARTSAPGRQCSEYLALAATVRRTIDDARCRRFGGAAKSVARS